MYDMRAFFNDRAALWDKTANYDGDKLAAMLLLSDIEKDARILDACCGTGVLEPYLLEFEPKKIWAVDFAENMIAVAQNKLPHPRIEYRCADLFNITDIECDYCVLYNAFPHFTNPKRLLTHLATLLRPGGRLTISHPQGKRADHSQSQPFITAPYLPAQGVVNLLKAQYRVDVMIDNNAMYLVSAIRL